MADYSKLIIRNLKVDMGIGIHDFEKNKSQPVIVNIEAITLPNPEWKSDSYDKVVCYETMIKGIQEIAARGHIQLVETYAEEIAIFCLKDQRVTEVTVRVEKPQIFEFADGVGIEIRRTRGQ